MKNFWKAVGVSAAWFAVFMAIQFWISICGAVLVMGNVIGTEGFSVLLNPDKWLELYSAGILQNMALIVLISNLLTILGIWLFFVIRKQSFFKEIGMVRTTGKNLGLAVIFGFGVCFAVDLLTGILPIPESMMEEFSQEHSMLWYGDTGLTFLSVAIIGPLSEEQCFRGLIYTRLRKDMGFWAAAAISSTLFGIAHGNPVWFLVGFLAGMAMAWIYETTGSLLSSILVHVTNNAISTVTAYQEMSPALHLTLVFLGIVAILVSGYFLYRENRKEPAPALPVKTE